jgi:hypothetical protein
MTQRGDPSIVVRSVAFHRNGISGVPFHVVLFDCDVNGRMVGVVMEGTTERTPNPEVAVLNVGLLAEGEIDFMVNSHRGDVYAPELCRAIAAWEHKQEATWGKR